VPSPKLGISSEQLPFLVPQYYSSYNFSVEIAFFEHDTLNLEGNIHYKNGKPFSTRWKWISFSEKLKIRNKHLVPYHVEDILVSVEFEDNALV
jgi:hypothetical protein